MAGLFHLSASGAGVAVLLLVSGDLRGRSGYAFG